MDSHGWNETFVLTRFSDGDMWLGFQIQTVRDSRMWIAETRDVWAWKCGRSLLPSVCCLEGGLVERELAAGRPGRSRQQKEPECGVQSGHVPALDSDLTGKLSLV